MCDVLHFSVLETPGEPSKHQPVLRNHSRASICRFHLRTCGTSLGGHEFHWIETKPFLACELMFHNFITVLSFMCS